MPRRVVNLALLVTVPVLVATGLLAWIASPPVAYALIVLHRVAGVGLVLALAWKYGIARRSVRRRTRAGIDVTLAIGGLAALALLGVLGVGLPWSIGLVSFDPPLASSLLKRHVFGGVSRLPLVRG